MKTDSLFYELFKAHPASLFELAGLETDGQYVFESITVKTTMQSSKCKMIAERLFILHFALCILHCFKKLFRNGKPRLIR